ncbi:hypothetical protein NHE_0005 [Neorickettsia helminthoeca str. Oregon]|uniref:Uncharacterized protein n=2 Tax=Neorickettsia helminthoeca TaxID=33994 RepID=X5GVB8_9RICK|nr:hypothetical protein NHE_0005 [Neorickettsia helminthoeca str. Oregon]
MSKFLKVIILLLLLFFSSLFLAIYVRDSDPENKYNLQVHSGNNILISIGYYIFKPILELYIDSRLDNYGLFDGIRNRLFYDNFIYHSVIKPGEGTPIKCGDKIKINAFGDKIGVIQQLEYQVGMHNIPVFNIAPIGMKKTEEATIGVSNYIAREMFPNSDISDFTSFKMEIVDIENSDISIQESEPIILDGRITNKKAKMCGDRAEIKYKVYDLQGKKIISDKANIKIGGKSALFENFVIGMQPSTKRTVIMNGNLIKEDFQNELKILVIELVG